MTTMKIESRDVKKLLIEGKTKRVFALHEDEGALCLVVSKDRITAGDGAKSHEMTGKSVLSTKTNGALFAFLERAGVPTHFVARVDDTYADWERAFVAKRCEMVPIEWVTRRVATGSFVRRNPNVLEGTRFSPPKLEHFYKDDANHDPFWSEESIVGAHLVVGGLEIKEAHVKHMLCITRLVFELLERVWATADHVLVDMKIEFGVHEGSIVVADVIDNDSWRLWPRGNKSAMLDKQLYRDLVDVSREALDNVKDKFAIVARTTHELFTRVQTLKSEVAIVLGSPKDMSHAQRIQKALEGFGVSDVTIDVTSAHKSTQKTLEVVARIQQWPQVKAIIAVAGLSNGLGPVIAGNCALPVINCPPTESADALSLDIWSSLRMPSGMGCTTVLGAENAARAAALIVGNDNPLVWARVRTNQALATVGLIHS